LLSVLVSQRVPSISTIIPKVAPSIPHVLTEVTPIPADFARVGPNLPPVGTQLGLRTSLAPVLTEFSFIGAPFNHVLAQVPPIAADLSRIRSELMSISAQLSTLSAIDALCGGRSKGHQDSYCAQTDSQKSVLHFSIPPEVFRSKFAPWRSFRAASEEAGGEKCLVRPSSSEAAFHSRRTPLVNALDAGLTPVDEVFLRRKFVVLGWARQGR